MRDRAADHRDAEEVLLRLLDALGNGLGNFLGLSVADAHRAFAVTHDNQGGEGETTSTLHDLGDAVDGNDALDVLVLVLVVPAVIAIVATAGAALTAIVVLARARTVPVSLL